MGPLAAPPWGEVFVPPLDIDMLVPTSSDHVPPDPVQTKLKTPLSASSGKDSLPSVGSGAHDNTVIPPSHDARTLILCFDGTGNHSVKDVRAYMLSPSARVLLIDHVPSRIPISYSSTLC